MDARHRRMTIATTRSSASERVAPLPRTSATRKQLLMPSRAVAADPVVLLPAYIMERLYDEQVRTASPVPHRHAHRKHRGKSIPQPHVEPRTSDSSSRPRTSTSSLLDMEDEDIQIHALHHSITMENLSLLPSSGDKECQVCNEKMDADDAQCCDICRSAFCRNCMRWYIEFKIVEGEVSQKKLVCPAPQCSQPLAEEYIRSFVSEGTFAKYLKYRENQQPGVRFCPQAGCCAKIDEPKYSTTRRVHCSSCDKESCMKCGGNFHVVPTCRRKERRYGKWRKRSNVRRCPSCKSDIEKQGGCAHMKCFQCDEEFCWSCMRPWDSHDETLCLPLKFLRSKDPRYGRWAPVRVVTKSVAVGAAAVVAVTGVGIAAVVLPPVLLVHWVRGLRARPREPLHSDAFIIE